MCGIQINKAKTPNGITHRGINSVGGKIQNWYYNFSSLPLSSNETGLSQPLKLDNAALLFNGEIFNYRDFGNYRSDLHYLKDLFSINLFSKRFLKEYKNWDGFWAICYIKDNVVFFTDPLGKKQLYYNENGICSEIKPIKGKSLLRSKAKFGTLNTNFFSVNRALPGEFYEYKNENKLAYKIDKVKDYLSIQEFKKRDLYKLIDQSVKLRSQTSYGKLGLLFSGGLDSSIIAYHLIKNKIDFTAISIENGEKEMCEKISRYLGFDVVYINNDLSKEEQIEAFKAYEHNLDLGSVLPQYKLFRKCKQLGLHTVLTGDGADELFGGYTRAKKGNTYEYDVFMELPYYHHVRLDRCSMAHTVECRNPFLSTDIINFSRFIGRDFKVGKKVLRDLYKKQIPFVESDKKPLRPIGTKEDNINNGKKLFNDAFRKRV
mgnify:CR=1 FL=1|jgi:asparagine synthase (glutamine-hydrolysing)